MFAKSPPLPDFSAAQNHFSVPKPKGALAISGSWTLQSAFGSPYHP